MKLTNAHGRSVEEWVGKTPDEKIPDRVRLRIFERYEGRCYLTGRKMVPGDKWEPDHIKALCNGGEHRESNLAPALVEPHKKKTREDRRIKAKADRTRKKHLGLRKSGRKIPGSRGTGIRKPMNSPAFRDENW